jgi:hypothetical protein
VVDGWIVLKRCAGGATYVRAVVSGPVRIGGLFPLLLVRAAAWCCEWVGWGWLVGLGARLLVFGLVLLLVGRFGAVYSACGMVEPSGR